METKTVTVAGVKGRALSSQHPAAHQPPVNPAPLGSKTFPWLLSTYTCMSPTLTQTHIHIHIILKEKYFKTNCKELVDMEDKQEIWCIQ